MFLSAVDPVTPTATFERGFRMLHHSDSWGTAAVSRRIEAFRAMPNGALHALPAHQDEELPEPSGASVITSHEVRGEVHFVVVQAWFRGVAFSRVVAQDGFAIDADVRRALSPNEWERFA